MTYYRVTMEIICPSDWDELKVREWATRNLVKSEADSVLVTTLTAPSPAAQDR